MLRTGLDHGIDSVFETTKLGVNLDHIYEKFPQITSTTIRYVNK
jgi:hypothetical protein